MKAGEQPEDALQISCRSPLRRYAPSSRFSSTRHRREEAPVLRDDRHAAADAVARRTPGHVLAPEHDASASRLDDAEDGLERRRFPGGVAAEKADELALADLERDALEDLDLAVVRGDAVELEHQAPSVAPYAEIGLDHARVGGDGLEGALGDLLAVVESDDTVRDALDHVHVVLDHEDRVAPLLAQAADQLGDLERLVRVHPRGRLVEEEQARLRRHGARDLEPAPVGIGEAVGGLMVTIALQAGAEERQQVVGEL